MPDSTGHTLARSRLIAVIVFFAAAYFYMYQGAPSLDLMALWVAGKFQATGDLAHVYPADVGIFTMYPPDAWIRYLRAEYAFTGPIYPYLYPPIWSELSAHSLANLAFSKVAELALIANCALMAASLWLVMRITNTSMQPWVYVAFAGVTLLATPIGYLALAQAQLQILVSFLILLALERSRFDAPIMAGIALALAASLKLYPALFALFWLATGERRAFLSFVITGAILAAFSVVVIGWPMHADFLRQISAITDTVFITAITVNFDAALAIVFASDQMTLVPALDASGLQAPPSGWFIMHRPLVWRIVSNVVLLGIITGLWFGFRASNTRLRFTVLWPLAVTLIALAAPMAWTYYYIPSVLFAATLPGLLGYRAGLAILFLGAVPMLIKVVPMYLSLHWFVWMFPVVSVLCLLLWCVGFALVARQKG